MKGIICSIDSKTFLKDFTYVYFLLKSAKEIENRWADN